MALGLCNCWEKVQGKEMKPEAARRRWRDTDMQEIRTTTVVIVQLRWSGLHVLFLAPHDLLRRRGDGRKEGGERLGRASCPQRHG